MSHADVYATVTSAGIECRHADWGDEKKPRLPWAVFYGEESPVICADDFELATRHDWTVELYEERRDKVLERKLGDAIWAKFGAYTKRESWVKSEGFLMVTYDFHEIERTENV